MGLAKRSGVSLGTIKRFERFGKISLENLIKISVVFDRLDNFDSIFKQEDEYQSLDEIIESNKTRKRGRIK